MSNRRHSSVAATRKPLGNRRNGAIRSTWGDRLFAVAPTLLLAIIVLLPILMLLIRSLHHENGEWIGLSNYSKYLRTPMLLGALQNSLIVSSLSAIIAVTIATALSFVVERTRVPGRALLGHIMMLPMYAPTMLIGLSLIYLFGRQGWVTRGFFGRTIEIDIGLYGLTGIIIAETLLILPAALLVMRVAMRGIDRRLDDATRLIGASAWQRLRVVVWPACVFGISVSIIACFILALTDFGAPKIVGGSVVVLPVQIYQQVVGQQNLSMGATIAVLLLLISVGLFLLQHRIEKRATLRTVRPDQLTSRADIKPNIGRDIAMSIVGWTAALLMLAVLLAGIVASVTHVWPWSISRASATPGPMFSFRHYLTNDALSAGMGKAISNSLLIAVLSATLGAAVAFISAYSVEKLRTFAFSRSMSRLLCLVPLAMPGLVIGLALVLLLNRPTLIGLPNPLTVLQGGFAPLVIANVVHFIGMAFLTTTTALRQQNPNIEEACDTFDASRTRRITSIALPLSARAMLDVWLYLFINAMTTVSAVIFLYSPQTITASIAVVALDDAGEQQAATALCVVILVINLLVASLIALAKRLVLNK